MALYVAHDCRNSRNPEFIQTRTKKKDKIPNPEFCNNRWVDVDMTGATMQIPTWKYCRECCEKLGIDFDNQKPSDYRTKEQNERIAKQVKKLQESRHQTGETNV